MSRNRGHLHEPQALFKEPTGRLIPQIMKGKALDAGGLFVRAGTVRCVERRMFHHNEARNSRPSRLGLAGAVHC